MLINKFRIKLIFEYNVLLVFFGFWYLLSMVFNMFFSIMLNINWVINI